MEKAVGLLRLIRPLNCLMMGFAVIVAAFIVGADIFSSSDVVVRFLLGFWTAFTLTGASMAINDYWDRDIDKVNEPSRPIPSGMISPIESLVFAAMLTFIGLLAAVLICPLCMVIAVAAWIVSVTYNTKGKRTGLPGNFLVSLDVAVSFIYGGFIIRERLEFSTLISAALAFLSITGREVTKGIVDVQGDKTRNIRTVAVSHGEKAAAYVASAFYILASFLSPLPIYLKLVSFWFIPFVFLTDVGFIVSSVLLIRDCSRENARKIKNLALLWMMFALIAFMAGSLIK